MIGQKLSAVLVCIIALLATFSVNATEGTSEHPDKDEKEHGHDEKEHGHGEKEHGHDDEHETSGKFGEGKAITEVKDNGKAFKLSEESRTFLGIRSETLKKKNGNCVAPLQSLVYYQSEIGVYTVRDGWIELRPITLLEKNATEVRVLCQAFKADEQIVVSGVGLVRVAHMEASGLGGQGHIH